jgi:hypothetical protein
MAHAGWHDGPLSCRSQAAVVARGGGAGTRDRPPRQQWPVRRWPRHRHGGVSMSVSAELLSSSC